MAFIELRAAAQQALEALESDPNAVVEVSEGRWKLKSDLAIAALRAALAEPQEPTIDDAMAKPRALAQAYERGWNAAKAELTVTALQQALIETDLIDPDAIEDPDAYDGGMTLEQIDALHRLLFKSPAQPQEPCNRSCAPGYCYCIEHQPQRPAEPVQEQDIEDAIEAAYWHFDARKNGLNEWRFAPQSERDAFKAEARKLVKGYFPTRQAQDTKREMLAVADAFIRGKRAALAEPVQKTEMRRCPRCWEPMFPPQPTPLTVERLRDALVASRIVPPAAVEDPDGYDDGVTLHRIEALHRRLA